MEIEEVAKALSSDTRLKIARLLAEGRASAVHVYKVYNERFSVAGSAPPSTGSGGSVQVQLPGQDIQESKEIVYRLAARSINWTSSR